MHIYFLLLYYNLDLNSNFTNSPDTNFPQKQEHTNYTCSRALNILLYQWGIHEWVVNKGTFPKHIPIGAPPTYYRYQDHLLHTSPHFNFLDCVTAFNNGKMSDLIFEFHSYINFCWSNDFCVNV